MKKKKEKYSNYHGGFNREIMDLLSKDRWIFEERSVVGTVEAIRTTDYQYLASVLNGTWMYEFDGNWYPDWQYLKLLKLKGWI